jgi:hypothetical protein
MLDVLLASDDPRTSWFLQHDSVERLSLHRNHCIMRQVVGETLAAVQEHVHRIVRDAAFALASKSRPPNPARGAEFASCPRLHLSEQTTSEYDATPTHRSAAFRMFQGHTA